MSNIIMDDLKQYIPTLAALFLFLWSEYLGVSTKHKSNAIVQLLLCMLSANKDTSDIEQTPPAVISVPPAVQSPSP